MSRDVRKDNGHVKTEELDRVTIRFAGDSGDGMQLAGLQFTNTSAVFGNDVSTIPDFPAEIRAPAGSIPGVSAFQVSFSSYDIHTPGDEPDVLVAMNPAALKAHLADLPKGGTLIVNTDEFTESNLKKANYAANPLEDGSLNGWRVVKVPISSMNARALADSGLNTKQIDRSKNSFALGLMFWLYERPMDSTIRWFEEKFAKNPQVRDANIATMKAGYNFGETAELFPVHYRVPPAHLKPGKYRNITGNELTALGFLAASRLSGLPLFYGSYPITPASDILHELAKFKSFGVKTFQAEDEIAAIGAAIGAAFGGSLGLTGTSGPGLALKSEALGLAVMVELPIVIAMIQRSGPSTGMPTKTDQADLLQSMFGRNGECQVAIVAPATPAECFSMALESFRIAVTHMTPTIFLSDGYLGTGAEPWRIPDIADLPRIEVSYAKDPATFKPYARDPETLARPWAVPGTPDLEHRIGGLEKADITGNVSYDAANHDKMVRLRAEKVERIANDIPEVQITGDQSGELLVLGWGSTYGAILTAVQRAQARGLSVSHAHLRHLSPFPKNLGDVISRFEKVLIPELNLGQLALLVRGKYLVDAATLNKVSGRPFLIREVEEKINALVGSKVRV
ncbi:MAG TPA: 2-oxoacid:acceptor oxidoreductase subunit alpha [Dehalococcoidia bacterium]|jgi:2-oxoglutarate ferredoxin oxidoreductase subunit alpha|nr:2-oxoacid:acceptor oxidoreductase subunit alpha [Dehalococcoidia bacterium]